MSFDTRFLCRLHNIRTFFMLCWIYNVCTLKQISILSISSLRGRERGVEDGEVVLEAEMQRRQLRLGEGHDVPSRNLSKKQIYLAIDIINIVDIIDIVDIAPGRPRAARCCAASPCVAAGPPSAGRRGRTGRRRRACSLQSAEGQGYCYQSFLLLLQITV